MPFTNWMTYASGGTILASNDNTYIRDNGRWLSHNATGGSPMCRVYGSTTVSGITSIHAVAFDTERYDIGAMHDTVTNNSRLTVPTGGGGKYQIGATIRIAYTYDGSGTGDITVRIRLNGTTDIARQSQSRITGSDTFYMSLSTDYHLAAADYVELTVSFSEASNVNVDAASNYSPEFYARWVAE